MSKLQKHSYSDDVKSITVDIENSVDNVQSALSNQGDDIKQIKEDLQTFKSEVHDNNVATDAILTTLVVNHDHVLHILIHRYKQFNSIITFLMVVSSMLICLFAYISNLFISDPKSCLTFTFIWVIFMILLFGTLIILKLDMRDIIKEFEKEYEYSSIDKLLDI